jgi:hypothetical protein
MFKYPWAAIALVSVLSAGCSRHPGWTYQGKLHDAIANADRMKVIDGGFDSYERDKTAKTLFEVSKPDEIKQFAEHLEFQKSQTLAMCPCSGYPRVDWFQGKQRLATVSIQHGQAIRWKGFQADAKLTADSSQWLQQWLASHGVDAAKMK